MDLIFDFALGTWQIILWGPDLANIIVKSRFYFCGKVKMNHLCLWSLKQKPWIEMGILLRIPDILLLCSFFLFLSIIEYNNYFIFRFLVHILSENLTNFIVFFFRSEVVSVWFPNRKWPYNSATKRSLNKISSHLIF